MHRLSTSGRYWCGGSKYVKICIYVYIYIYIWLYMCVFHRRHHHHHHHHHHSIVRTCQEHGQIPWHDDTMEMDYDSPRLTISNGEKITLHDKWSRITGKRFRWDKAFIDQKCLQHEMRTYRIWDCDDPALFTDRLLITSGEFGFVPPSGVIIWRGHT